VIRPIFNSLQAFWPGLQVLYGDVAAAMRTHGRGLHSSTSQLNLSRV
jgi:hypothetical protein